MGKDVGTNNKALKSSKFDERYYFIASHIGTINYFQL